MLETRGLASWNFYSRKEKLSQIVSVSCSLVISLRNWLIRIARLAAWPCPKGLERYCPLISRLQQQLRPSEHHRRHQARYQDKRLLPPFLLRVCAIECAYKMIEEE